MSSQDEIDDQLSLLVTYRRRLAYHLEQQAILGINTPFSITEEIRIARERIRSIKITLRDWGSPVEDHPDDGSTINPNRPDWATILPQRRKSPKPLTEEELQAALQRLPNWISTTIRLPRQLNTTDTNFGIEIMRTYKFASFKDAVSFIHESAIHINKINHHPRWENVFRSVTVWLSTWDINHRISQWDVDLAEYLDTLFQDYKQRKSRGEKENTEQV
jgi:pterin-4a-carbinolamine dehydratase